MYVCMYVCMYVSMYVCMHVKTSFRKAEHECSIGKRGHILVNLGQFKVETLLNSIQICRV